MGYPHFSGDCGEYHDRIVDWGRNEREPLDCPEAPGGHHSYRHLSTSLGVEYWQCAAPIGDPADDRECGARFERKADDTFIPAGVVTLSGSTRFRDAFTFEMQRLTLEGWIVLSVGLFGHDVLPPEQVEIGHPVKDMLDQLHFRKIDMSDRVHVINLEGYIGQSTQNEIDYAVKRGRTVTYLEAME